MHVVLVRSLLRLCCPWLSVFTTLGLLCSPLPAIRELLATTYGCLIRELRGLLELRCSLVDTRIDVIDRIDLLVPEPNGRYVHLVNLVYKLH